MSNKDNTLPGNPNTDVDDMLKETELGDFLSRNKTSAIAIILLILVGVFGSGIYSSMTSKKIDKASSSIYTFESTSLKELKDKKLKPAEFIAKFNMQKGAIGNYPGAITMILASSTELKKQGENSLALEVLKAGTLIKESYAHYILSLHLAASLEDAKDYRGAATLLETLTNSKIEVSRAKIYLDLGRLYLLLNDGTKAKVNFQYVIDNLQDKEMMKIAKMYLSRLS